MDNCDLRTGALTLVMILVGLSGCGTSSPGPQGEWTWVGGSNIENQTGVYGIQGTPSASNSPGGRQWAVGWRDKTGNFWLFGGWGPHLGSTYLFSDLWKYSAGQWTWISAMNTRTRTFWLPALVSLTAAMACLTISTLGGLEPRLIARGWATYVVYIPWLVTLPLCGAAGAYLSRRAGGERWACLAAGLFPVIAMTSLVGVLTVIGKFIYAKPHWLNFSMAALLGLILPGMALFLGAAPFARLARTGGLTDD